MKQHSSDLPEDERLRIDVRPALSLTAMALPEKRLMGQDRADTSVLQELYLAEVIAAAIPPPGGVVPESIQHHVRMTGDSCLKKCSAGATDDRTEHANALVSRVGRKRQSTPTRRRTD